jgi:hypothetical protein
VVIRAVLPADGRRVHTPLRTLADELGRIAADAIAVPTDVRDEAAAQALARAARAAASGRRHPRRLTPVSRRRR